MSACGIPRLSNIKSHLQNLPALPLYAWRATLLRWRYTLKGRTTMRTHLYDTLRKVCQLGHMDTKTLITDTFFDLVQQCNVPFLPTPFSIFVFDQGFNVQILNMRVLFRKGGKLVEVGCEETEAVDLFGNVSGIRSQQTLLQQVERRTLISPKQDQNHRM